MSKENILKHLRAPEGVDEDSWEKRILLRLEHNPGRIAYSLGSIYAEHADKALEDLCDRCEELEQENARLRKELAKSRLTWSDEVPREEGWYWIEFPSGASRPMEYCYSGIYTTGVYSITDCTPDGTPRRNCRIPEPQEPSE